jgi:hypothetical protein
MLPQKAAAGLSATMDPGTWISGRRWGASFVLFHGGIPGNGQGKPEGSLLQEVGMLHMQGL